MSSPTPSSGRAVKPAQLLTMLLAFLLVSGMGGLLAAGLVMPVVSAVGTTSQAGAQMFDDLPSELAIPEPSQSSEIRAADGSVIATIYADNRIVVPLDEISEHMQHAIVALEDRRFYEHRGVDPEGMARAFVNNLSGGDLEGASTLTQQYVKNALVEEGRITGDAELIATATETSYGRKLEEARLAMALEQRLTKDEILEGYLNIAQFGRSQYGVEAAANYYFSKSAADLTVAEAALLAGITQSPARYDPEPEENREGARDRRDRVLRDMLNEGFIDEEQYEAAVNSTIGEMLDITPAPNGCAASGDMAYFCEYVVDELLQSEEWGETFEARRQALYRGGLVINTTLVPERQRAAAETVRNHVPINDPSGIKIALSSVEPGTGDIQAMAQNTHYGSPSEDSPSSTTVNLNVGRSHGGGQGFQGGSSFKVFALVQWLKEGRSLNDVVQGDRRSYPRDSWNISCGQYADDYEPRNIEGTGRPRMTVAEATRQSINLPFVEMANQMDMCDIVRTAEEMGVETGEGEPLTPWPSAVLGSNNVTPLSQAVAFATLANRGERCDPRAITSVTERSGEEIASFGTSCERVLDEGVANAANHALQAVVTNDPWSTGRNAVLEGGRPAAGKTGTANDASAAWFVGYTPQLSTAVWMGFQEGIRSMFQTTINGQYYNEVFGSHIPAPAWRDYTNAALRGEPAQGFAEAGARELYGEHVPVPRVAGQSVDAATSALESRGFRVRVGSPVHSNTPEGSVATTSPNSGSNARHGSEVTIHPSQGPAPNNDRDDDDNDEDDDDNRRGNRGGGNRGGGDDD